MKRSLWILCGSVIVLVGGGSTLAEEFTIVNTDPDGVGSLAWAVEQANDNIDPDTIKFDIPTLDPVTIYPERPLVITDPGTNIDGFSQPGAIPNTNPNGQGLNTKLMISVSGANIERTDTDVAVFHVKTIETTIQGLNIHSGPVFAIAINEYNTSSAVWDNNIQGCFIGTDITGTQAMPNRQGLNENLPYSAGIALLSGAGSNSIGAGSVDPKGRNLISGQMQDGALGVGVLLLADEFSAASNSITGNLIGTTADAAGALPNLDGVAFIGGVSTNTLLHNVISGNLGHGIFSELPLGYPGNPNKYNSILDNLIGLDPITNTALPNTLDGIHLERGSESFYIGTRANGNVISGNGRYGIFIQGDEAADSNGNLLISNLIGLDPEGVSALPNGADGVRIEDTQDANYIGSNNDDDCNFISGNLGYGIVLKGASNVNAQNNAVGLNAAMDSALPNQLGGIAFLCSTEELCCSSNMFSENNIGGNHGHGISILGQHVSNTIGYNDIGSNTGSGVYGNLTPANNNVQYNTIDDNFLHGIELEGSSMEISNNTISSNQGWGIACYPSYGADTSPENAGDDVLAQSSIYNNEIIDNKEGGIINIDTESIESPNWHLFNTFDSGTKLQMLQLWYGAVEILDQDNQPILSGDYTVTLQSELGHLVQGEIPSGGLWGPAGWTRSDALTWFQLVEYLVTSDGTTHEAGSHTVTVTGPTGGTATYSFDGFDNDTSLGGQPAGILTGDLFRYQVAEVATVGDSDQDGVEDQLDCAPADPDFNGPAGNPCDGDDDGYCNQNIVGLVQESACPNDICSQGLCIPTDCDDLSGTNHPNASEAGETLCTDTFDNDCDGMTDGEDPDCIECAIDDECNDGNLCNGAETCLDSTCQVDPIACDDSDPCTIDRCDPDSGCFSLPFTGSCDDGNYCTVDATCQRGQCEGQPRDCSMLNDNCNTGACDEELDQCVQQPVQNGTTCNDQNTCTQADSCQDGVCTSSNPVTCTALDQCHDPGTCNPETGLCSNPEKPNDTACDDQDACTMNDTCKTGSCTGDDLDEDGDGASSTNCGGSDCNDSDKDVKPSASEVCDDGIDNNCDGLTDDEDGNCATEEGCSCATSSPLNLSFIWPALSAMVWLVLRRRRGQKQPLRTHVGK